MTEILIIEDNAMHMDQITYLLKGAGYTIVEAKSGEDGMRLALQHTPDLILCDLYMRDGADGFDVGQQLKRHPILCAVPLVAVTLYTADGDKERILAMGFDGYIPKPIAPKTFAKEIETFLISVKAAKSGMAHPG